MALLPSDPRQRKKLFLALAPVLLLFAYWYFMHGKRQAEILALDTRLQELEARNATARTRAMEGGPDLEKKLALYQQHISRLEELVPKTDEVPELLHDMTLRAQENGVELAVMTPRPETPGTFYTLQTYEIAVLGGYHDIGRFLAAIGSLPRILTPVALSLDTRPATNRDGTTSLQAKFRIQAYVLPAQAPVEAKPDART